MAAGTNPRILNKRRENAIRLAQQAGHEGLASNMEANKGTGGWLDFMR